jgi:hypothetical protein
VRLVRDELDKRIEAFLAELVPPNDSGAERRRFVLVAWLARTYVVRGHTCPSAESRREFGTVALRLLPNALRGGEALVCDKGQRDSNSSTRPPTRILADVGF